MIPHCLLLPLTRRYGWAWRVTPPPVCGCGPAGTLLTRECHLWRPRMPAVQRFGRPYQSPRMPV
eukprot:8924211-Alexandrium_andersonii.AAC.1